MIRPMMEYADVIWDGRNEDDSELIESVKYEAARVVTDAMRGMILHFVFDALNVQLLSSLLCYPI